MAPELVAGGGYGGLIREKPHCAVVGLTYLAKSSLSVTVSRSMHDKYVRITKPHHSAKWLQHTFTVSGVICQKADFRTFLPWSANSTWHRLWRHYRHPSVSHAQLARHEWLQLVVSSQWERDSYRGYISVARHRARLAPGLKVRGHGGAEWRTVMMWGWEGVLGTTVLHSHWGTFHKTYLLLTPAFTVTFKVKNESNPFFSSYLFLPES